MERNLIISEIADSILAASSDKKRAELFRSNTQRPNAVQPLVLDLSTARDSSNPLKVSFGYRSLYVQDATDIYAEVSIFPVRESLSSFKMRKNDAWITDQMAAESYLTWEAQSGKTMTLVFFTDSQFMSGSQISVTGGGVSITNGSTFSQSLVALVAATATQIVAVDSTRKNLTIQNLTGSDIWLGPAAVSNTGATTGFKLSAGATTEWKNTAALYGFSVGGGNIHQTTEI